MTVRCLFRDSFVIIPHLLPFVNTFFKTFLSFFRGFFEVQLVKYFLVPSRRPQYSTTFAPFCQYLFAKFFGFGVLPKKHKYKPWFCASCTHIPAFAYIFRAARILIPKDLYINEDENEKDLTFMHRRGRVHSYRGGERAYALLQFCRQALSAREL